VQERCCCLEDLDSLITDHNRSFFLNELDGFASNEGVVTIASTNHPERLGPAIMARPSRFDRKYHFGLPDEGERLAYLELWRARLDDAMRPSAETVAALAKGTESFSFAYVKELMVAATVRWAERQEAGTMDGILSAAELGVLREQMQSQVAMS
jgi:ATP-dependent 26S proteasome regulatory subunit